jgi:hypothetical protein
MSIVREKTKGCIQIEKWLTDNNIPYEYDAEFGKISLGKMDVYLLKKLVDKFSFDFTPGWLCNDRLLGLMIKFF